MLKYLIQYINKYCLLDILLEFQISGDKELFRNLQVDLDPVTGKILFRSVLEKLKESGFPLGDEYLYSYFNFKEKTYEFIGNNQKAQNYEISPENIEQTRLQLKIRQPLNKVNPLIIDQYTKLKYQEGQIPHSPDIALSGSLHSTIPNSEFSVAKNEEQKSLQKEDFQESLDSIFKNDNSSLQESQQLLYKKSTAVDTGKCQSTLGEEISLEKLQESWADETYRRAKERKIDFVIDKVKLWRRLYNGVPDQNGILVRYNLEEAAQKTGLSKKSLDDYLLQIRFGKKYGFDFQKHRNDSVGVLRQFVKKQKQNERLAQSKNTLKSNQIGSGKFQSDQILEENYFETEKPKSTDKIMIKSEISNPTQ